MVYTSLNKIWLCRSTDGSNWGNEILISDNANVAGYPSIAVSNNLAYVVWQDIAWAGGNGFDLAEIYMRSFDLSTNTLGSTTEIASFTPNIQNFQANPVIDGNWGSSYDYKMIAWREPNGIKVKNYTSPYGWSSISTVSGSNSYSYNPSIAYYSSHPYLLCWEDQYYGRIKYIEASWNYYWSFPNAADISPSNWTENSKPQITLVVNKPTIVWTSRNNIVEGGASVHVRQKNGSTWE